MPPPAANNKPNRQALKVRREKIRTKKKAAGSVLKHKIQVAQLLERNPKRQRKLGKRKAALERHDAATAAAEAAASALVVVKAQKPKKKKDAMQE